MLRAASVWAVRNISVVSRSFSKNHCKMSKKAMVLIAGGTEEMEFVISVDILRRAGVDVIVAGIPDAEPIKCSRDVVIKPDVSLNDAVDLGPFDAVILPGGLGGSNAFCKSEMVGCILKSQLEAGKLVAAICAAPTALKAHKVGLGKCITSYPSFKETLADDFMYSEDNVVVDGNLITSRGPGTAFDFGLAISEYLVGKEKATDVKKALLL